MWDHRDVVQDVYDLDDLLDAHEILDVKQENKRRADEIADLRQRGLIG
ncbi:hypothetical protein BRE01_48740 [Brevibacillus reuszeri]|uniref:Uncharacterized protein n=1 Tax=Brevibacillus reuszeri TaxID=54915 RepID=A0ABQ0TUZ0_9BACL|nr:hypothetical protein BRE01_48740 [Brevibacillus reuszeri]